MRLKLLILPISIVVSACIIIVYILPEITNIQTIRAESTTYKTQLQTVKEKVALLESLSSQVESRKEDALFVKSYLPENRTEERILTGLAYLAMDSGVLLINVKLESHEGVAEENAPKKDTTANTIATATKNTKKAAAGDIPEDQAKNQISSNDLDLMNYTEATVSIGGDYENIKIFLSQIYRMPIINSIKSLEIKNNLDNPLAPFKGLTSDVVIDFNYLEPSKLANQAKFNATELDTQTIETLREYISQKAPILGDELETEGKENPFLP